MKTLLFLLLLAFGLMPHSAFAQHAKPGNPPPGPAGLPPGESFVGTWQCSAGGEVFRMTLTRDPNWTMNGITRNVLTGQHRYTRNGVVIDQYVATAGSRYPYSLFGVSANGSMSMWFHEFTPDKCGHITLTLGPGNPDQLTWHLEGYEGIRMYTGTRPSPYFVSPLTMTFTRQP